ncbi:and NB-ARC domain-containing protein [Rutstroemia sp. NJR-2017a WRK4]|nr:and NB-ARC domain-containing protein [Rutstroemia sp. NJR-2017a WRK4]
MVSTSFFLSVPAPVHCTGRTGSSVSQSVCKDPTNLLDGAAINPNEINRFEVTEVYAHPEAQADIVLVHGLNGHPQSTWTAKNGVFWPTELLPVTFASKDPAKQAKVRILVYGYNADVVAFGEKSASTDKIHEHAQSLVSSLALERKSEEADENPIIWVAHSLGGILVKRALEISHDYLGKSNDEIRSIAVSTFGIIFLGTPHTGADPAKWGLILQGMVSALIPKKAMDTESVLIKTLMTGNETLANINLHFLDIYQRYKICMVHESLKTDFKGTKAFVVDQASASPLLPDVSYFGVEATHSGMCKFESKRSPGYMNVSTKLKTWALECPPIIRARWKEEMRKRTEEREAHIRELRGDFGDPVQAPPMTHGMSQGSFPGARHPPARIEAARPTRPLFDYEVSEVEERDTEMVGNHISNVSHLSNSGVISTSMVQSVVSIEPDFVDDDIEYFIKPPGFRPNSIFIGRQEELVEMHRMLFDERKRAQGSCAVLIQCMAGGGKSHLARQYAYDHKHEFPGGIFWLRAKSAEEITAGFWQIARKAALKQSMANEDPKILDNPDQFIKLVKKWLNHRHDWLLVFDGIHFEDNVRRFIPDSKNTSIIYTSTEKSVSGDHHFMNPQILKLPPLSAREAQRLLLFELDKKEPFFQDDLKNSMQLVQAMQFLPVVIHVVAQRLKATDEPLSRYAKSYASAPKGLRELQAFSSIVEQLEKVGAYETLNLIRILCFFSQHVPVEMISLGLAKLDVPVKASERITGKSLNNTFKVLNKFALIDRNEHETSLQSSQTSRGSRDLLADNIDVIRLHSVVQGFFIDTLHAKGELPMWLDRAINVFCHSFTEANERITRKTPTGLVEDYRLYEIHGTKLQGHLERYKKEYIRRHKKEHLDPEATAIMLEEVLIIIQGEIERRTPECSHMITGGRPDAFQTSIFDRTSSSSDTGADPDTPADRFTDGTPWALDGEDIQIESPSSLIHDPQFLRQIEKMKYIEFPPRLPKEDTGYDTDREASNSNTTLTLQPPAPSLPQASPESPGGAWETVQHHRTRAPKTPKPTPRPNSTPRRPSFRPPNLLVPRVTHETAHGVIQKSDSRPPSRGRLSGRSSAEVALAHISKASPPPIRGAGMIQDRRRSSGHKVPSTATQQQQLDFITRTPSYAAAVAGQTRDTASRCGNEDMGSDTTSLAEYDVPAPPSAVASLQRIPHEREPSFENIASPVPVPYTPMPPYPSTPGFYYQPSQSQQPYPSSTTDLRIPTPSTENQPIPDPFNNIYPPLLGPLPIERSDKPYTALSPPRKRDLPHGYGGWDSQSYPNSLAGSVVYPYPSPNANQYGYANSGKQLNLTLPTHFQSLSSPNLPLPEIESTPLRRDQIAQYRNNVSSVYIPDGRRPEFSSVVTPTGEMQTMGGRGYYTPQQGNYTYAQSHTSAPASQAMSRDHSGRSTVSAGGRYSPPSSQHQNTTGTGAGAGRGMRPRSTSAASMGGRPSLERRFVGVGNGNSYSGGREIGKGGVAMGHADTDPLPQVRRFAAEGDRDRGLVRKSPRLGTVGMVEGEGYKYSSGRVGGVRGGEEGFNPQAKVFEPRFFGGIPVYRGGGEEMGLGLGLGLQAPEMKRGGSEGSGSGSGGLRVGGRVVGFGEVGIGGEMGMERGRRRADGIGMMGVGTGLRRDGSRVIEFGETGLGIGVERMDVEGGQRMRLRGGGGDDEETRNRKEKDGKGKANAGTRPGLGQRMRWYSGKGRKKKEE